MYRRCGNYREPLELWKLWELWGLPELQGLWELQELWEALSDIWRPSKLWIHCKNNVLCLVDMSTMDPCRTHDLVWGTALWGLSTCQDTVCILSFGVGCMTDHSIQKLHSSRPLNQHAYNCTVKSMVH